MARKKTTPIGRQIKKRLIDKGMTLQDLAVEVGASKQYISHIINGYRTGDKYLPQIKEVLGIKD